MDRDVESFFCFKGSGKSTLLEPKWDDSYVFGESFVHLEVYYAKNVKTRLVKSPQRWGKAMHNKQTLVFPLPDMLCEPILLQAYIKFQ